MPRRTSYDDPRLVAVRRLGREQGQVVSRKQVYGLGVTRWEIRGEVRARRWQLIGDQSVCLHNGELSDEGSRWAAVFQGWAASSARRRLLAGGVGTGAVHDGPGPRLGAARGAGAPYASLRHPADPPLVGGGSRVWWDPAHTGGRGGRAWALWARTDKEATYLLTLIVQQGLERPEVIGEELLRIRRDRRRLLLHEVVNDLLGGARSLGELDVARELRRRGLPEPSRQVLRRDRANRYYLDLFWPDLRLVVEIDGIHHSWAENIVGDALRQNALAIQGDTVLRLPLLGLRLEPDAFYAQIQDAMLAAGWRSSAA